MPELPEVETIVRDLNKSLPGDEFKEIIPVGEQNIVSLRDFDKIKNKKITEIKRIGKFINIFFENDFVLTFHLRMTGNLILCDNQNIKCDPSSVDFLMYQNQNILKFTRVRLIFKKHILVFSDIRKFGRIWINKIDNYKKNTNISNLGIDPFTKEYNFENFQKLFYIDKDKKNRRKGIIKNFLLNQSKIAGIGNIYADEILFDTKIHPKKRIEKLSKKEIEKLFISIKKILSVAIKNRGTTFSDYKDARGEKGRNQNYVKAYSRGGKECYVCGEILQKDKIAQRGTVWCEKCQKTD